MDEIRRKLAQIDRQLAGVNYHQRIITTCPLVFVASGLIAGILIQSILPEPKLIWLWSTLLILCLLSAMALFRLQTRDKLNKYAPELISSCALICFLSLGAVRLISFRQPPPNDIGNLVTGVSIPATIRGLVITEPYINEHRNWRFAGFRPGEPSSSFYLKVKEAESTNGWIEAAGTVRVYVSEPVADLKPGDHIQLYCRLDRFDPPTNPGQFDIKEYMERRNVFIAAFVKSRGGIEILHPARSSPISGAFTRLRNKIRTSAGRALSDNLSPGEPNQGLLRALLLGYRGDIDSDTYRAFRKTGLLHFISLSGLHLGILVAMVWWLCKTAGLMKPSRAVVCIIVVAVFLLVVPPRAPTLRAAIITWVFCLSFIFRRHSNPLNTLSLAAIVLLLIRPTHLFEAGWQLSFATVLGIILLSDRIYFFINEKVSNLSSRQKKKKAAFSQIVSKAAPYLLGLFCVGLAAWLGGAGILLYHFHTITPLAGIWTVLVFPLVTLILVLGFLKIIMFFLLPVLSSALAFIVTNLSDLLIRIVELIAGLNISQLLIGRVPLTVIILYYCIVVFAGFVYLRRPSIKKITCAVMLLTLFVLLAALKWQRTRTDRLVVTFLDVGHGQAIFAQLPGKAGILFDAGSLNRSDIGRRIVNPFLDYKGISKIDALCISHNDTDHINGIPEIVEHCEVGSVYTTASFIKNTDRWGAAKYLNDFLVEKKLKPNPLGHDFDLSCETDIKILWPTEEASENESLGDNDKSQVSLIEFAGRKVLLCSDIEKYAQRKLLELNPELTADIVLVPHHGSVSTLDTDFLRRLEPRILVYSCSTDRYGKPQIDVGNEDSLRSFYTCRHGAIDIRIDRDGQIKTYTFIP
jgi:competence protein ComEC